MAIQTLRIGLAVGHGTGQELAAVFRRIVEALADRFSFAVEFIQSPHIYHSYHTLIISGSEKDLIEHIATETAKDAQDYRRFCETIAANGVKVVFRTAIHAQSLYQVREQLQAVKVEHFRTAGDDGALLFIRDEAQGFYAGSNEYRNDQREITRNSTFSRSVFDRILRFTLERARDLWGPAHVPRLVTFVYKFHLFDGVFQAWAPHWRSQFGIDVEFVQPDTMNRNLMATGLRGHRVIIAGNEYADIIQPIFLNWFSHRTPETMYAENVYLHPDLQGLTEYQTVHGSADAIAGQGLVNPFATIRAAAAVVEQHGGGSGVQRLVDQAFHSLEQRKLTTADQGGSLDTDTVVTEFLHALGTPSLTQAASSVDFSRAFLGKKSALVVVDFQNDFISNNPSPAATDATRNIPRLVDFARDLGQEVIFVRFLGNSDYQRPPWQHRDMVLSKPERCIEGSWGAELGSGVSPQAGERVFDKKALFDPFLVPEFAAYLSDQGIQHLLLAGFYTDVCVDATARTAFQKGLWITVLSDCTSSLHRGQGDHLAYMEQVYGARIATLGSLSGMKD